MTHHLPKAYLPPRSAAADGSAYLDTRTTTTVPWPRRSPAPWPRLAMQFGTGGSSGQLVEKEIKGGNPAVPDNDEISPGVSGCLTRAARYPLDATAIA